MAEENAQSPDSPGSSGRKAQIKMIAIILVVMLVEGLAISGVFIISRPAQTSAASPQEDKLAELNKLVEVQITAGRFMNNKRGRTDIYDVEIWGMCRKRHLNERVEPILQAKEKFITAEISEVFRRAENEELERDDSLGTLTRQIKTVLDRVIGYDEEGKPLIEEVYIPRLMRFSPDG